jgi:hypothetical protein
MNAFSHAIEIAGIVGYCVLMFGTWLRPPERRRLPMLLAALPPVAFTLWTVLR